MSADRRSPGQRRLDADLTLGLPRLRQFVAAMLPIALGYGALFGAGAIVYRNAALGVGVGAIAVYIVTLLAARRELGRARVARAALLTGSGLLAMIAIASVAVHFQFAAFPLIAIAAVIVVLPHVDRRVLIPFALIAIGVVVLVVSIGLLPPVLTQPPAWFQAAVTVSSVVAAAALITLMLAADHQRMRELVEESAEHAAAAQRARAATDAFLLAAAHQFRTPVSTLLLQSEALLANAGTDERTQRRLERLVRAASRLRLLVDAMLDVSRVTSGTLELDRVPLDMSALVRDVAAAHRWIAEDAGVDIVLDAPEPVEIEADVRRLELVTSHLIENAIRNAPGAPARIEVRRDGGEAILTVTDRGHGAMAGATNGIDVFDRDAAAPIGPDGGPGIGLWLVRALSRAMGGDAHARPGSEPGTRLEVRLPQRPA